MQGEAWEVGQPGASARAEYRRRLGAEAARRNAQWGRRLGPLVNALSGPSPATAAWERGGRGEETVGRYLTDAVGAHGIVLHDRAVPGRRANIDHIAVVASGVWVIDTKRYRGRVARRGGWVRRTPALEVNGRDRTNLVTGAVGQRQLVQRAIGSTVPVHAALCFADAEWGWFAKPFSIGGVLVTWPRGLAATLSVASPSPRLNLDDLAGQIAAAFPAYAPSGTSHNPTGAWPRG